ncbi:MAG: NAD(P)-binding domain-containing protein [Bacteroidetes bacterium]|nr:NAD(P)-binding domain-containing protein [Bacteroidota bacterium]
MNYNIKENATCAVIGYGSWGTAIAKILLENEKSIGWHIINPEVQASLKNEGINNKYLTDVHFDDSRLDISDDINYIVSNYDILVFAVPSAFLPKVISKLNVSLEDKFVVSAIKGIVNDGVNLITVAEYFNHSFAVPFKQIGLITGPCHAEEVALERLSYLNVVCKEFGNGEKIAKKFRCPYIRVSVVSDIYGIEYSTVLKNIYALSVGICSGLGYGDNFMAVLITNAQREVKNFIDSTYACDTRDVNTSPYLGDLLVTSYSKFSRNRTFGVMIGKGYSVENVKIEMNMVAEGYYASKCIHEINSTKNIEMPIANAVYNILYCNKSGKREIEKLSKLLK